MLEAIDEFLEGPDIEKVNFAETEGPAGGLEAMERLAHNRILSGFGSRVDCHPFLFGDQRVNYRLDLLLTTEQLIAGSRLVKGE